MSRGTQLFTVCYSVSDNRAVMCFVEKLQQDQRIRLGYNRRARIPIAFSTVGAHSIAQSFARHARAIVYALNLIDEPATYDHTGP